MKATKMKRTRSTEGNTALNLTKDTHRLAQPMELSYRVGGWMMRKSLKAALYTAGIASTGFITSRIGLPGFSGLETILAPPTIGLGVLALGAAIKHIPNTLSSKMVTIADANDLNKMEKLKELQSWEHLDILWNRVFAPESYMRYSSEERRREREGIHRDREYIASQIRGWDRGILKDLCIIDENGAWDQEALEDSAWNLMCTRPLSKKAEKSRIGFKISAMYAMNLPFISSRKHAEYKIMGYSKNLEVSKKLHRSITNDEDKVGFTLELYKDWMDGAYFDYLSDGKVSEQYRGHDTLNMFVKKELGFGRMDALKEMPGDISRRFWFYLVTKRVTYETGKAIKCLDERYKTDRFNALVLLWPGEEHAEWLDKFPGAEDDVLRWRKLIIRKTFGKDYGTALDVINRAFSPDFESATRLRLLYDPDYWGSGCGFRDDVSGLQIPNNIVHDLTENGYSPDTIERTSLQGDKVTGDSDRFLDYLSRSRQDVFDDPESKRAAGIAFHTNRGGLRDSFMSPSRKGLLVINRALDEAAEAREMYTNNLIMVRQHHTVSLLRLRGYRELVKELGYDD